MVFRQHFLQVLQEAHPTLQPASMDVDSQAGLHVCLPCKQVFATRTAWATHTFHKHGRRAPARYLADTVTCEHCFHTYLNPHRLYLHLRHSVECYRALRLRGIAVEPLPGRGSRTWQAQPQFSQCPYLVAAGPRLEPDLDAAPLPTLAPHEMDLLENLMQVEHLDWIDDASDIVNGTLCPAIRDIICCHPTSLEEIADVLRVWSAFIRQDLAPLRRLRPLRPGLVLQAIDRVLQQLSYVWLLPDLDMTYMESPPADHALNQLQRIPLDMVSNLPCPSYGPRTRQAIYIHLYSGRRRLGDFQAALEALDWGSDAWPPLVISLDIVIHAEKGNIMDLAVRRQWLDAIRRGFVTGALMGPPCETWSVARERWHIEKTGPRPLRSSQEPWGFSSLLVKEARQVYTANALLCFAVAVHVLLWIQGRAAVTEHPDPPDPVRHPNAPSIWRLAVMTLLDALPANQSFCIYQGLFGAPSPKPTIFMGAHTDNLEATGRKHQTRMTLPPPLAMGRHGGREYATFQLKEYPAALNAALAEIFQLHWLHAPLSPSPCYPPPDLLELFHDLCATEMQDGQEIGPDFAF
eukprot:Skav230758  [mRNA]  locus=scaffold4515:66690:68417:+ [translate_table: standard]